MDPTLELAQMVLSALRASSSVVALVGATPSGQVKIYDRVPEDQDGNPTVSSPYISLGPSDAFSEDAACVDAYTITMQIDAWSWGKGEAYSSAEARKIAWAVRKALHHAELTLTHNALVTIEHRITRFLRARDGVTNQAAITITAFVEG